MIATIKVGRTHVWDVDVVGEPITDKFWFKDESTEPIEPDDKITIDNSDYSTRIAITKAQRRVSEPPKSYTRHLQTCCGCPSYEP